MRINYLNQPKSYPSIETAQSKHYSQRELEKRKDEIKNHIRNAK